MKRLPRKSFLPRSLQSRRIWSRRRNLIGSRWKCWRRNVIILLMNVSVESLMPSRTLLTKLMCYVCAFIFLERVWTHRRRFQMEISLMIRKRPNRIGIFENGRNNFVIFDAIALCIFPLINFLFHRFTHQRFCFISLLAFNFFHHFIRDQPVENLSLVWRINIISLVCCLVGS